MLAGAGPCTGSWSSSPGRRPIRPCWPSDTVTIAVQVNGKRRDEIVLPVASSAEEIEAAVLSMDNVRRAVGDKTVRRVVVVPGRIANVVTD